MDEVRVPKGTFPKFPDYEEERSVLQDSVNGASPYGGITVSVWVFPSDLPGKAARAQPERQGEAFP